MLIDDINLTLKRAQTDFANRPMVPRGVSTISPYDESVYVPLVQDIFSRGQSNVLFDTSGSKSDLQAALTSHMQRRNYGAQLQSGAVRLKALVLSFYF